ncbi:MAG: amidohydrolase [Alphaproteobacteria bacterium]|nr:amidohydrolase [Alphaproteobacteria bacterium]
MSRFVFSADGHVVEPPDLFLEGLPASMKPLAIHSEKREDYLCTVSGDKVIFRLRLRPGGNSEATSMRGDAAPARKAIGSNNIAGRLKDMEDEGISAEIVFPSLGLWTYALENPDVEQATTEVYNNWNDSFFSGHTDTFVRCGILPVRDLSNTVYELKRIAAKGFTAAMLPSITMKGIPAYNDPAWDPIFHAAGELGVAFVLHTGTGAENVVVERGPGAAVMNYTRQMCDGQNAIMALVAGGVLDRNPKARVAVIESGASWLAALAERMDEVYLAHAVFVRPKLSKMPSEIIRAQVKCSFQYDRACIIARSVTGHEALMWGSDYPHAEGTFPHTPTVLAKLFDGIDISERQKADILGGNAARLFRLNRPEFAAPA